VASFACSRFALRLIPLSRDLRWHFQTPWELAREEEGACLPVEHSAWRRPWQTAAIYLTSNMATWCLADDTHRWHGRAVNNIHPLDLIMSGRVQKDSADDSDRVDDAVDPRVQVSARCRRRPRARTDHGRGGGGVPAILTLSSSEISLRLNRAEKNHVVHTRTMIFTASLGVPRQFPFSFASVSYFFPSLRPHTRTNHKTSPILKPLPPHRRPARIVYYHDSAYYYKLPSLPGDSVSTREIGAQCIRLL